jgi:hypothetical protein
MNLLLRKKKAAIDQSMTFPLEAFRIAPVRVRASSEAREAAT